MCRKQEQSTNDAVAGDAQNTFREEEYASNMEQRRSANTMDAPIMWSREECALGMGQKLNYAAIQDALIRLREEECALGMEQRLSANTRDAQIMWSREECARGTEHTAILMKILPYIVLWIRLKRLLLLTPLLRCFNSFDSNLSS